jgi:hypothetical protein
VLVLALIGVLWAMSVAAAPPGATELTKGDLSTDIGVVSPTIDDAEDRTIEVTLDNADLNIIDFVGTGPDGQESDFNLNTDDDMDDDDVILVAIDVTVQEGDEFRIRLSDERDFSPDANYSLPNIGDSGDVLPDSGDVLPIVDRNGDGRVRLADIEIVDDEDGGTTIGPDEVTLIEILDAGTGSLRFEATEDLSSTDSFGLRFATSPQETALVSVRGDGGSFDLLGVEDAEGASGEYIATFVADEEVIIDMTGGIVHEQHNVPAGLRGNVEINDERIRLTEDYDAGETFTVTVNNPPIRPEDGPIGEVPELDIDIDTSGVTLVGDSVSAEDAISGTLRLRSGRDLDVGDEIEVSYRGSDSFEITLEHAPVQSGLTFVVPSDTSDAASFNSYFAIVKGGAEPSNGKVTIGVIVGEGDDDEDLDEPLPGHITVLGVSYDGSELVTVTEAVDSGDNFEVTLDSEPQDANDDGDIDRGDIVIMGANVSVVSIDGDEVEFRAGGNLTAEQTFEVAYALRVAQNPRNALLPEEGDRPIIQVGNGSRITITSDDDRTTVDAEADAPTFDNVSPAHGSATDDLEQVISIDITDALAGVDEDSIRFLVSDTEAEPTDTRSTFGNDRGEDITITKDGDVVTASVAMDDLEDATGLSIDDDGETTVYWFVQASDEAGNMGTTDADTDDDAPDNQGFSLRVDNKDPVMMDAFTGEHWDANADVDDDDDKGSIKGDRRLKVGEYLPSGSNAKMIRVEFNEALDGASVDASDFSVTDGSGAELAIAAVRWFDKANDDEQDDAPVVRNSVFIELEESLGGGDTPSVELAGTVTDAAGNSISNVTIDSDDVTDGIAPTATVTMDTTLSKEKVVVTVRTDENIRTLEPNLELFISTTDDPDTAVAEDANVSIPRGSRTAGENEWTYNLSVASPNTYSVVVSAEDTSRNRSTTGKEDWTDSGSISFEIDDNLPSPRTDDDDEKLTTVPEDGEMEATLSAPFFIEINWGSEDEEYTGDSHEDVTLTKAVLDAGEDNERDVIGLASTRDGQRWTVAVDDIGLGEHTLTFNGEDSLGNTLEDDEELTFTVVARPVFELGLAPGLNLVSIPGDPTNKDINAVFGDHPAVDLVYTRDGDLWLVAQRDAESGMFEATGGISDLTSIDAQHAYFVRATASVDVGVDISSRGALQVPPSIAVKGNQWNLVPVISLLPLEKIPMGSALDADTYLGTENWTRGFTFDRGRWMGVVPNAEGDDATHQCHNPAVSTADRAVQGYETGTCGTEDPNNIGQYYTEDAGGKADVVEIGRGYWVWFTKDGTITP